MIFRKADVNDFDACVELFGIAEEDTPDGYFELSEDVILKAVENEWMTVADEGGKVVGMAMVLPPTPLGEHDTLYILVTDRDHRGGTLAPDLIAAATHGKTVAVIATHALDSFLAAGYTQKGFFVTHG